MLWSLPWSGLPTYNMRACLLAPTPPARSASTCTWLASSTSRFTWTRANEGRSRLSRPSPLWPASAAREAAGRPELDLAPNGSPEHHTTAEAPYFRPRCSIASAYRQRTSRASPPTPPPPVGASSPWLRCGSTARARFCSSAAARYATQVSNPRPAGPQAGLLLTRLSLALDSTTRASHFGRLAGALDGAAPGATAT